MISFAHRGDSSNYPENTLLAFKKAIKSGASGIELDVHKTKDNKLVVIHDEKINRTYLGSGYVKDYTLEELKKFKCKKLLYRLRSDCKIPKLDEVLELIKDKNIILNIEIKNNKIKYKNIEEDVINKIREYKIENRVIISSFNHKSLLKCKNIDSAIKTGMLYSSPIKDLYSYSQKYKVDALHPSFFLISESYLKEVHKWGLKVNVYTINVADIMKMLIKWEIDGIITDCPSVLKKVTDNYNSKKGKI